MYKLLLLVALLFLVSCSERRIVEPTNIEICTVEIVYSDNSSDTLSAIFNYSTDEKYNYFIDTLYIIHRVSIEYEAIRIECVGY